MTAAGSPRPGRAWLLAARPATLPAAIAPVVVGSAFAAADDVFRWDAFLVILLAALAIQIGVNFANDLADARRGADTPDRIGPTRVVAGGLLSEQDMRRGIIVAFAIAAGLGVYLVALGGWVILAIGVTSIAAALGYTGGPWPYGYRGWGEVFVFVFFGLAATVGTRYVYDRSAPLEAWIAGVIMGLLAMAILEVNNIRDIETDRVAGKRTLAVILGRSRAQALFAATLGTAFVIIGVGAAAGWLPAWCAVALLAAPLAAVPIRTVYREIAGPPLIAALQATARLQLLVAILLAAGVLIS